MLTHSFFGPYITNVETRLSYQERVNISICRINFTCNMLLLIYKILRNFGLAQNLLAIL